MLGVVDPLKDRHQRLSVPVLLIRIIRSRVMVRCPHIVPLHPAPSTWWVAPATGSLQVHLKVDRNFVTATKAHAAFEVPELRALRARLEKSGIAIVEDEPLEGFDRFYVSDPFGNRVECLTAEYPEGHQTG